MIQELTVANVEALLNGTRSRTIQYLCRAYLGFGADVMSEENLNKLRAAVAKSARSSGGK